MTGAQTLRPRRTGGQVLAGLPCDRSAALLCPFSSGSSTSAGAARWRATAAPSASRRTGQPTRSTAGRRGAPCSTSLSRSDDRPVKWLLISPGCGRGWRLDRGHQGGCTCPCPCSATGGPPARRGAETAGRPPGTLLIIYMLICL